MLDTLIHIDHVIFDFINQGLSNSIFDFIMPIIRNKKTWIPFYIFLAYFLIKNKKKEGLLIILFSILCVGLADGISSHLLKPYFERIRPCYLNNFADHVNLLLDRCSGAYSLPSSHAANHFALAIFLAFIFRSTHQYLSYVFIFWASSICFAQVYVGVHFPFDVFLGAIIGATIAVFVFFILYKKTRQFLMKKQIL